VWREIRAARSLASLGCKGARSRMSRQRGESEQVHQVHTRPIATRGSLDAFLLPFRPISVIVDEAMKREVKRERGRKNEESSRRTDTARASSSRDIISTLIRYYCQLAIMKIQ
jgi:hypothetical protein